MASTARCACSKVLVGVGAAESASRKPIGIDRTAIRVAVMAVRVVVKKDPVIAWIVDHQIGR